jgi:hypothetical protein
MQCPVCGQGFLLYWERTAQDLRESAKPDIEQTLRDHHIGGTMTAHPESPFNIPSWTGQPQFSAAALLGGAV